MADISPNYFIIERKDSDKESDSLKNIYDLSILDKIKSINRNKKEIKNTKKLDEKEKENIIRVVKKVILSTNLAYKWKVDSFKIFAIFFQLVILFLATRYKYYDPNKDWLLSLFRNYKSEIEYNISIDLNQTFNNITNDTEKYFFNIDDYNTTNTTKINNKYISPKFALIVFLYNQIFAIPFWLILFYNFVPKWNKMNHILCKITKYLLKNESLKKGKYYFSLMKNYSLLVVKKKFLKRLQKGTKNKYLSEKNTNRKKINKDMFNYCITIINDYIISDFIHINYNKLISNADLNDINILINYIKNVIDEVIFNYTRNILIPIILIVYFIMYNYKIISLYFEPSTLIIYLNWLIIICLYKRYYKYYQQDINKFIDNYNSILIQKNRFIFKRDELILFFALKNNHYSKDEIINSIKKIIA